MPFKLFVRARLRMEIAVDTASPHYSVGIFLAFIMLLAMPIIAWFNLRLSR